VAHLFRKNGVSDGKVCYGCHAGQHGAEGPLGKEVGTPAGKRKGVVVHVNRGWVPTPIGEPNY